MSEACSYLIIGGGSAGCILARRLAQSGGGRVILLEAGKIDEGNPAATDLARLDEQTAEDDWGLVAIPWEGNPSRIKYARARMLGGCANHNDCAFIRPPDSDFAEWEQLGAAGWGPRSMDQAWASVMERITIEQAPLHPMSAAFIAAGHAMGLDTVDFAKDVRQGVGRFPLNARGRARQSSSIAYLHPLQDLPPNLEVWTETTAIGLLFEGHKVVGAETSRGKVLAEKVILACGAIHTPQLLMVSGIGPAEHLQSHGITVRIDNPHVGSHLRDHVAAPVVWQAKNPVQDWEICPFEATMMLKLEDDAPAPDILFHFGLRVREKYVEGARFPHTGFAVKASPNVTRARSEGTVRLSGPRMDQKPVIALNYFSDPYDLPLLTKAMKFTRKLFGTKPFADVLEKELFPGPSVQSGAEWQAYIRDVCETVYHPCCTAAIGKVVDEGLRVKGTENLFIADASVFPSLITVNINAAVMMVAERAAKLLA